MVAEEITAELESPLTPTGRQKRQSKRRKRSCLGRVAMLLILGLLASVLTIGTVAGTLVYADWSSELNDGIATLETARDRETFQTTQILDRNGYLLWEIFGEGKRTNISLAEIPLEMQWATIAVEDDTFYTNNGLDAPSLLAALIANLRNRGERPIGASTITQQLVRHLAFDYEERTAVSYDRKSKEIVLAWTMTREYSKDEILNMYLNEIYYGNLAYGVEAAAQTYFGITASELTLGQSALLAAIPQNPVDLDPFVNFEAAQERQWLVLNLMVEEGFITTEDAENAYLEPIEFVAQEVSLEAPHFAVYVRQQLDAEFGPELVANGGLRVTTTLDMNFQRLAEALARQHIANIDTSHNLTNASLVALKPGTGEILAMLGSIDYRNEAIDGHVNIALSQQQPGSAIKPITYAAALASQSDDGSPAWTAADILWDVEVTYPQFNGERYTPVNYDGRYHGPVRLRAALANSYNIPAVLLLQDIGLPAFLNLAGQMGINSFGNDPGRYGLAITLGGAEVTPLELTSAYAVFANGGNRIPPVSILSVATAAGEQLFEYEVPEPVSVLDSRVAHLINDILDDDEARIPAMGRENPLALPFAAAAKTGTSNDFRDNWTVGYTPGLVVGVWAGNSDNSPMVDISGLTGAAPLWSAYVQGVYGSYELLDVLTTNGAQPPTEFVAPAGLESRPLCSLRAVTVGATECTPAGSELFLTHSASPASREPEQVSWQQVEPGVWQIPALLLPGNVVEVSAITTETEGIPADTHCLFSQGSDLALLPPDAHLQLFLTPPRNEESLAAAYEWASLQGLAILPTRTCTDDLLILASNGDIPAVWRISSPAANSTVSGILPIVGTASFDPVDVQFYKIELGRGDLQNPEWITLGQVSAEPVIAGTLEMLHAAGLAPGDYLLRLILITWDGNYVGEPHTIQITIVPE